MCFHGSILVAQRFLEINFQMMFLVLHVSYSVLCITFKFSMWCFQAMNKICNLLQLKEDCRLLVELGCHPCLQIKHGKAVTTVISGEISLDNKMVLFFSEGKTMEHSPFIYTTGKGSMAQLPLVLV